MKKPIMKQWVMALRSGEVKQTDGFLENEQGNCCLGVLCNLALVNGVCDYDYSSFGLFDDNSGRLPDSVKEWSGMDNESGFITSLNRSLLEFNDINRLNFREIADIIEKYYKEL